MWEYIRCCQWKKIHKYKELQGYYDRSFKNAKGRFLSHYMNIKFNRLCGNYSGVKFSADVESMKAMDLLKQEWYV